jgi:hypothetical protein
MAGLDPAIHALKAKASASFLKKRSKKLLLTVGCDAAIATTGGNKSFMLLFRKKRSAFLHLRQLRR